MIHGYLYDAEGKDREVDVSSEEMPPLASHQLLWLDVVGREPAELERLVKLARLESSTAEILGAPAGQTRHLEDYEDYFSLTVTALAAADAEHKTADLRPPKKARLDFIVGKNWLITVADEELSFLTEFRTQDRGETLIGALSSAALAASLLDWHLTRYLETIERLEAFVDALDVRMLAGHNLDRSLLRSVVSGRRLIASLRRGLAPQRQIFYGLSRPDFQLVAEADATEHFKALERRFDRVVDALEHGRELVQGSFDLYTTRVAENTNTLVRRITFLSIMLGAVGAVAGIFGMNFQTPYTESGVTGFWLVVGSLLLLALVGTLVSKWRNWI